MNVHETTEDKSDDIG